jgi:hypothetical protein
LFFLVFMARPDGFTMMQVVVQYMLATKIYMYRRMDVANRFPIYPCSTIRLIEGSSYVRNQAKRPDVRCHKCADYFLKMTHSNHNED